MSMSMRRRGYDFSGHAIRGGSHYCNFKLLKQRRLLYRCLSFVDGLNYNPFEFHAIHPVDLITNWPALAGRGGRMVYTVKKLGVRKPQVKKKKRRRSSGSTIGEGFVKKVVEGFKSMGKTLYTAKQRVLKAIAEWVDAEQNNVLLGWHRPKEFIPILPPMKMPTKTIVLDLDETLVHSSEEPLPRYDFTIQADMGGQMVTFYVLKRPGVDRLLDELGEKFELVLFTAAVREYANPVLDRIDPRRTIRYRLFRDSCREISGKYVKDLSMLGRDLRRIIIVDDNPNAYMLHPQNALPVSSFVDDLCDRELASIISFSRVAADYEDLREAIRHYAVKPSSSPYRNE